MNTNEQQAQRDKLMELGSKWAQGVGHFGRVVGRGGNADLEFAQAKQAFEEFRDYVEHMHDWIGKAQYLER